MSDVRGPAGDPAGGYPVGLSYLETVQPGMSPASLARVALARQKRPPDPSRPYRYCELGCGVGGTLAALATAAPQSEFYGVDYMPGHVAAARHAADALGLDNLRVDEGDFARLADAPPPGGRFDFVTMHGVWSWVSDENRAALLRLLEGWVAPGGVVYVSYNARPFWNAIEPLRYVLRELLGDRPEMVDRDRLHETVDTWAAEQGEAIRSFWTRLRKLPTAYLVHEFTAAGAAAFWPMDLGDRMAAARLEFTGHAEFARNFPRLVLDDAGRARLEAGRAAGFPRVADDLAMAHSFREDVFDRGAPALSPGQVLRALAGWELHAARPRRAGNGDDDAVSLSPKLEQAFTALAERTPCDVATAVALLDEDQAIGLQALLLAVALKRLALVSPPAAATVARIERFNAYARQRREDGAPMPGLICARRGEVIVMRERDQRALSGAVPTDEALANWLAQYDFPGSA